MTKRKIDPRLDAIWQATQKPFRYTIGGERHIEFKRGGRNAVVALTEMTEGEIVELVRQAQ
jgi:hypothetical protein